MSPIAEALALVNMKKISDAGPGAQIGIIIGIMTFVMGAGGSFLIWAADAKIDQKYATDEDLLAVQQSTEQAVFEIKIAVEANTATVKQTTRSIDGLLLSILDVQISDIETEIAALEADKRAEPAAWNERDERNLRDRQKALADLDVQRQALFARLITPSP